ncbi:hypothetical protein BUALT_Bualt05G0111600 [Buddleja alternifolia]|uniref:Uncharacterized protein n=1 Tax=Buddleja alternifolia TaxID=168488 RepID=A0AAV6XKB6_9LAMI|nr:hypothetical protein BUALT_Bualt05G0111600 [Buddleja alternifolia]
MMVCIDCERRGIRRRKKNIAVIILSLGFILIFSEICSLSSAENITGGGGARRSPARKARFVINQTRNHARASSSPSKLVSYFEKSLAGVCENVGVPDVDAKLSMVHEQHETQMVVEKESKVLHCQPVEWKLEVSRDTWTRWVMVIRRIRGLEIRSTRLVVVVPASSAATIGSSSPTIVVIVPTRIEGLPALRKFGEAKARTKGKPYLVRRRGSNNETNDLSRKGVDESTHQ